jgi:hypothetical protein
VSAHWLASVLAPPFPKSSISACIDSTLLCWCLQVADPEDACQPLAFRYDDEPWVALISRSQHLHPTNCTFDVKVRGSSSSASTSAVGT